MVKKFTFLSQKHLLRGSACHEAGVLINNNGG